jgi:hypothetical protein
MLCKSFSLKLAAMQGLPAINLRLLKIIKFILTFYRNYFIATTAITICCIWIFHKNGISSFFPLFWFKIVTLGLIYFFIKKYKEKEIYYYQNLGVSQIILWSSTVTFDLVLFIVSLIITYKINAA